MRGIPALCAGEIFMAVILTSDSLLTRPSEPQRFDLEIQGASNTRECVLCTRARIISEKPVAATYIRLRMQQPKWRRHT